MPTLKIGKDGISLRFRDAEPQANVDESAGSVSASDSLDRAIRNSDVVPSAAAAARAAGSVGGSAPSAAPPVSKVSGTILLEHGLPASKVKVRLYQIDFGGKRSPMALGEVTTNDQGGYELPYAAKGTAIAVYAVAADGKEVQLSRTKFNAPPEAKLDLVAPTRVQPAAAEFTRLRTAVAGQLPKPEDLGKAVEHGERRDISLLAQATGWDARVVALASTASCRDDEEVRIRPQTMIGLGDQHQ